VKRRLWRGGPRSLQVLASLPRGALVLLGLALVGVVAVLDYETGWEIYFSLFYLLPIALVSWFVGRRAGIAFALVCSVAWLASDLKAGHVYSEPAIAYWNTAMQLGFFLIISLALSAVKRGLERENQTARTDLLTSLATRRTFFELAAAEIQRCARYGQKLTVARLRLDDLAVLQDREGHAAADRLLVSVANAIRDGVRAADLVARSGEAEFLLLLPETGGPEADVFLGRIRGDLDALMRKGNWRVRFSMGSATFDRPPGSVEEILRAVDEVLYSAKGDEGEPILRRTFGPARRENS